jgi:hypothetical protein
MFLAARYAPASLWVDQFALSTCRLVGLHYAGPWQKHIKITSNYPWTFTGAAKNGNLL